MTLVIFQSSLQRIFKVLFNSPRWHLRRQVEVYSSLTSGSAFRTVRLKPVFTIANSGRAARSENDDLRSVQADLSQAVDLSVEPVRAIARNSLAGSRRWDAPRDAPHSRVLERFANFASLFRCDAALREIVHDLIDVPLDGAGRVWLFLSVIVRPPAHRRWTAATLRPQSGLRPALQGHHFDCDGPSLLCLTGSSAGRSAETSRARSSTTS